MKSYVKPELYFESFELSQHIATCDWDMNNHRSSNDCTAVNDYGDVLFTKGLSCELTTEMLEDYCYEPGHGNNTVFNS